MAVRFAREGLPVAVVSRSEATARAVAGAVGAHAVPLIADSAHETALRAALDTATDHNGLPDVVVYNAAVVQADAVADLTAREHLDAWAVNVGGALTAAAHLLPAMARRGSGSFIVTGGMPEPKRQYVSLSLGLAAAHPAAVAVGPGGRGVMTGCARSPSPPSRSASASS